MILTQHGKNSRRLPACIIGGRQYKVVKIGTQFWMAENLDYKFTGCTIGGSGNLTTPGGWYYNGDEATYGIDGTRKCGLLYNWYAVDYIEQNKATLCPGWHVPDTNEWLDLQTAVSNSGAALKAQDGYADGSWPSGWNGTNTSGFSGLPAGRYWNNTYAELDTYGRFWTSTPDSNPSNAVERRLRTDATIGSYLTTKVNGMSVRLLHD